MPPPALGGGGAGRQPRGQAHPKDRRPCLPIGERHEPDLAAASILLIAVIASSSPSNALPSGPRPQRPRPPPPRPPPRRPVPAGDPAPHPAGRARSTRTTIKRTTDARPAGQGRRRRDHRWSGRRRAPARATTAAAAAPGSGTGEADRRPLTRRRCAAAAATSRGACGAQGDRAALLQQGRSADDSAVRRALSKGRPPTARQVFVDAHWIKTSARYQAITRGADVEQSPTIVVADRDRKAESLVGYVDAKTIDQAVVDALVASGGSLLRNPYFRRVGRVCASAKAEIQALPAPAGAAAIPAYLDGVQQVAGDMKMRAAAIKPGRSHRSFHKAFVGYSADTVGVVAAGQLITSSRTRPTASPRSSARSGRARRSTRSSSPSTAARYLLLGSWAPAYTRRVDAEVFAEHLHYPRGRGHAPPASLGAAGGAACGDLVRIVARARGRARRRCRLRRVRLRRRERRRLGGRRARRRGARARCRARRRRRGRRRARWALARQAPRRRAGGRRAAPRARRGRARRRGACPRARPHARGDERRRRLGRRGAAGARAATARSSPSRSSSGRDPANDAEALVLLGRGRAARARARARDGAAALHARPARRVPRRRRRRRSSPTTPRG